MSNDINEINYFVGIEMVTGSYTNITNDLLRFNCHRAIGNINNDIKIGDATFILNNSAKYYSPANSSSPYYDLMRVGLNIKVIASNVQSYYLNDSEAFTALGVLGPMVNYGQLSGTGSGNVIFSGKIQNIYIDPVLGSNVCNIDAIDNLQIALNADVRLPLSINVNPSQLIYDVCSTANIVSNLHVDNLAETIPYYGTSKKSAITILNDLLKLGAYTIYASGEGEIYYKNRHFKVGESSVNSYSEFYEFNFSHKIDEIFNHITIESKTKKLDTNVQTVCYIEYPQYVPSSGHLNFFINYINPYNVQQKAEAKNVLDPVPGYNYVITENYDGTGADITSQCSLYINIYGDTAQVSLSNVTSYSAYLTLFTLQGNAIYQVGAFSQKRESTSSQSKYGKRSYEISSELLPNDSSYLSNYAAYIRDEKSTPNDIISISINSVYPDVFTNDLTDLISVIEPESGVDGLYMIESIEHDISPEYKQHVLKMGLKKFTSEDHFRLDNDSRGVLDDINNILLF